MESGNARKKFFLRAAIVVFIAMAVVQGCKRDSASENRAGPPSDVAPSDVGDTPYYHGLIEEYRSILDEDPNNLAAIIALGNAMYDSRHWKGAIHYYDQALQIDPHMVDVMTDKGTCYRNLGQSEKAIEIYERVLAIEPNHHNALFNVGVVYGEDRKDYLKAIDYWNKLLHVSPTYPKAESIRELMRSYKQMLRKKNP